MGKLKHGKSSHKHRSKEYRAWLAMKQRCFDKNSAAYKYYGAIGITVCRRWVNSFEAFLKDMGVAPSNQHTLDRKHGKGNYQPSNCRWATMAEQSLNKRNNVRITFANSTKTLPEWSRELGIGISTIRYRFQNGLPINVRQYAEPKNQQQ